METITEDYVSFETAKLLKEKGFSELTTKAYPYFEDKNYKYDISCPTLQMAMKWLREVQGLFVSIGNDDLDYNWQIFDINDRTKDLDPTCLTESYAGYRKYEQAVEAAIKYCLEHLI